jgi:hypothetical protein
MDKVEWEGLEGLLNKTNPTRRVKLIKLIHNWQNTGRQKGMMRDARLKLDTESPLHPTVEETNCHLCPGGCGEEEGTMHYLHCSTIVSREGRKRLIKKVLRRLSKLRTSASIMSLVGYVLVSISEDQDIDPDSAVHDWRTNKLLARVINGQEGIGWMALCQGFYHKAWSTLQHNYYMSLGTKTRYLNIRRWKRMFSTILCEYSLECWEMRNKTIHGENCGVGRERQLQRLREQVKELYKEKRNVRGTKNGGIFDLPLEKRQKMGIHSTKLWIGMAEEVLRLHRENATKLTLHQWLQNR